jgi:CubicO group peptidase (beta-lactamase class C family)
MVFRMAFSGDIEKQTMLKLLSEATIVKTEPGIFDYDNLGYNIYGLALQEYMNKKWQDVLQEKIFTPLGMNRTTAYISLAEKNKWPIASPYNGFGEKGLTKLTMIKKDNTMQSAGGLVTTASDISKWLQIQLNHGKINNKQIYPVELIRSTQAGYAPYEKGSGPTPTGKYAFGWNISKYEEEDFIFHFGGYPGYKSHISFMPQKKIGLAIFVNEGSIGGSVADVVAMYIYDQVRGVADADKSFVTKVEQLQNVQQKETEGIKRAFASRAGRTSQLTLPLNEYIGTYKHDWYGDMVITVENNSLAISFGNMHIVSTPFTEKETVRIELMPGQGRVISFKTGEAGKINSLVYDNGEYKKVK